MAKTSIAPSLSFVVTYVARDDEDAVVHEVTTSPYDMHFVARRGGKDGIEKLDQDDVTTLWPLAWSALARTNRAGSNYEAWLIDVADIELVTDEKPDPTPPGSPR